MAFLVLGGRKIPGPRTGKALLVRGDGKMSATGKRLRPVRYFPCISRQRVGVQPT